MPDQLALDLALVRVHCFTCPHTVDAPDPQTAHDEMGARIQRVRNLTDFEGCVVSALRPKSETS